MSNGRNLPDVPQSWNDFAKTVLQVVALLFSLVTALMTMWNNRKIEVVQEKQTQNTMVIQETKHEVEEAKTAATAAKDIAATHSRKVESKLENIDRKTETIKAKTDNIEKKADAIRPR